MKILLMDPNRIVTETIEQLARSLDDLKVVQPEQPGALLPGAQAIDVIVGVEDASRQKSIRDPLLSWRTDPHSCLVPCWVLSNGVPFEERCLWPSLAIDRFGGTLDAFSLCKWLSEVAEWRQNRVNIGVSHTLSEHGALELATSLSLRKATGRLAVFDHEGNEGALYFHGGRLTEAFLRHLRGAEAFHEFLSRSSGSYHWSPKKTPGGGAKDGDSIALLIPRGLLLMKEANLLYHFIDGLDQPVSRTDSEAALDDGAIPFYREIRKLYHFIQGEMPIRNVLDNSPVSRPRTMNCLAKWLSMGDLQTVSRRETAPRVRLLVVDDSSVMCRALQSVFATDPRFDIVGVGHDGHEAIKLIQEKNPDVVTLDLQMPIMDGLTALKHIMTRNPKPVVLLSAFTTETPQLADQSSIDGVGDALVKPVTGTLESMRGQAAELRNRIIQASCVKIEATQVIRGARGNGGHGKEEAQDVSKRQPFCHHGVIVAVCGAGGFPSLLKLLLALPRSSHLPPFLACVALSRKIVESLLPNLQRDSTLRVEKIADRVSLASGCCYPYSHEDFVQFQRDETGIGIRASHEPKVGHRPFDTILRSTAELFGSRTLAVLISGIGDDGIDGMRHVKERGGQALVLSPKACLKPDLARRVLGEGFAREIATTAELVRLLEGYPRVYARRSSR